MFEYELTQSSYSFLMFLFHRKFIILLLADEKYNEVIRWTGKCGEFVIKNTEKLAYLWGTQSNNKQITYISISRSFREYYKKKIMQKSHETYGYKFTFDCQKMVGYSFEDLIKIKNGITLEALAQTGPNRSTSVRNALNALKNKAPKKIWMPAIHYAKIVAQLNETTHRLNENTHELNVLKKRLEFLEKHNRE